MNYFSIRSEKKICRISRNSIIALNLLSLTVPTLNIFIIRRCFIHLYFNRNKLTVYIAGDFRFRKHFSLVHCSARPTPGSKAIQKNKFGFGFSFCNYLLPTKIGFKCNTTFFLRKTNKGNAQK